MKKIKKILYIYLIFSNFVVLSQINNVITNAIDNSDVMRLENLIKSSNIKVEEMQNYLNQAKEITYKNRINLRKRVTLLEAYQMIIGTLSLFLSSTALTAFCYSLCIVSFDNEEHELKKENHQLADQNGYQNLNSPRNLNISSNHNAHNDDLIIFRKIIKGFSPVILILGYLGDLYITKSLYKHERQKKYNAALACENILQIFNKT